MPPMRALGRAAGIAVITCILHWSAPSRACGAAYPPGAFARLASERTVLVWDAETKTEHFIRKPVFEGDPTSFGFFVPTPTLPVVEKAEEATFDRVAALVPPPALARGKGEGAAPGAAGGGGHVEVLQRVTIDAFELVSLKASSSDELGGWLGANGFTDRPELRRWTQRYLSKGWIVNAMKYAGSKTPRAIETPTLRLSFAAERPFYPYTEPEPSMADERAYAVRAPRNAKRERALDLWVVAREPVNAYQGADTRGPRRIGSASVPQAALSAALGDTKAWRFEPRGTWAVTHFQDDSPVRTAFDDLTFSAAAPSASAAADEAGDEETPKSRYLALVIALAAALGVAFALSDATRARA